LQQFVKTRPCIFTFFVLYYCRCINHYTPYDVCKESASYTERAALLQLLIQEKDFMSDTRLSDSAAIREAQKQGIIFSKDRKKILGCRNKNITEVIIPDGVTSIHSQSFKFCCNLVRVVIPAGVKYIGQQAFDYCFNLKEVVLPDSVRTIGEYAFDDCKKLKEIVLPAGVRTIGACAFGNCSKSKLNIPASVKNIGIMAFDAVKKLTSDNKRFQIKEGGVLVDTKLKKLIYAPLSLSGTYRIPEGVAVIGKGVFAGHDRLVEVTMPEGVTVIEDFAFDRCNNLRSVFLPESVTHIGGCAFLACQMLEVNIPSGVTEIGSSAFVLVKTLSSNNARFQVDKNVLIDFEKGSIPDMGR
jgi:hypothetical protein